MAKKTAWFDAVSEKVAKTAFHIAGYYPVYLACKINAQSAASQGEVWAQVAVCSTILAAVLFEVAVRLLFRRNYVGSMAAVVGIIPFFAMNMVSASGNVASADVHAREVRQSQARISANRQDDRADAVERRKLHDNAAMGETVTSAEAKIKEAISKNATLWAASGHCRAESITLPKTKAFCGTVADLEAKREHAREADKARDDIARIDAAPQGELAMQSTAEGAGANVASFAATLGYSGVNGDKVFEYARGGSLEALATIAPGAMALLASLLFGSGSKTHVAPSLSPVEKPTRRFVIPKISFSKRKADDTVVSFPLGSAREFHRRYLEPAGPNDRIKGGDMQKRYTQDCARVGVDPLERKMLSQALRACGVAYGKDSGGRPHYYGLRWRDVPLPVSLPQYARQAPRLAVDNTAHAMAI